MKYLGFFHRSCVLITHRADLHSPLPLLVSLLEKFLHDAVCPLPIQFQGLGGVAQVCTVYHVAKDLKTIKFWKSHKIRCKYYQNISSLLCQYIWYQTQEHFGCIIIMVCAPKKAELQGCWPELVKMGVPNGKMCVFLN